MRFPTCSSTTRRCRLCSATPRCPLCSTTRTPPLCIRNPRCLKLYTHLLYLPLGRLHPPPLYRRCQVWGKTRAPQRVRRITNIAEECQLAPQILVEIIISSRITCSIPVWVPPQVRHCWTFLHLTIIVISHQSAVQGSSPPQWLTMNLVHLAELR